MTNRKKMGRRRSPAAARDHHRSHIHARDAARSGACRSADLAVPRTCGAGGATAGAHADSVRRSPDGHRAAGARARRGPYNV